MKLFLNLIHLFIVVCFLWLSTHLKDPHLLPWRVYETPLLLLVALTGTFIAIHLIRTRGWRHILFLMAWVTVFSMASYGEYKFRSQKQAVLKLKPELADRLMGLGQHLVVGYNNTDDIGELVRQGFIAGLFVTRRNSRGKTFEQLGMEINKFQDMRRQAGLPQLIIASDQEGGPVSRLTPPLPRQPALATLLVPGLSIEQIELSAEAYGAEQGEALANLGVNTNFSPVIDLKPTHESGTLDFHTRIVERSISVEPETVAQVALAYSRGLLSQGVMPTVKHFPGLGGVVEDTHHFSARLKLPLDELREKDWYPFRLILGQSPALLMVGHVIVNAVDPEFPASMSYRLITDVVRENWKHEGVLISDDMTMAAVYNRGLCESSVRSLNAGVDLLLLAYDWEKVYPVIDCLLKADKSGQLNDLKASRARLDRLPWRRQHKGSSDEKSFSN